MVNFQCKLKIVKLSAGTCFAVLAMFFGAISFAQQIPGNIKVIIPFAPGGPTDVLGRIIAESLQKNLKSTVITETFV